MGGDRPSENEKMSNDTGEQTISVPEAGRRYFGLCRNASYAAAERGEIPYMQVGRLKRVPVRAMERKLDGVVAVEDGASRE
jgi:hypothetical protein